MLHKADSSSTTTEIKQVEINTMASGLGHISTQMTKLHRYQVYSYNFIKLVG